MTPQEVREYVRNISLSWVVFIFGGLFVLSAIQSGAYFPEAFLTFIYGFFSVYLDQLEEAQGLQLTWTRRVLFTLWILLIASRYLSVFQNLHLWAH